MFLDPIPTPAGRHGRRAVVAGMVGWVLLLLGLALRSIRTGLVEDTQLDVTLTGLAGIVIGVAVVVYIMGALIGAAGVTTLMNKVPDPGMKWLVVGFVLNGVPIVLLASFVAYSHVTNPGSS